MKRGEPMTRRTPLKTTKPLQAKATLSRSKGIERVAAQPCTEAKPAKAKKPRSTGKSAGEQRARRIVRERSGGMCEVRRGEDCTWRAAEWSHRKNRSQGGKWTPGNGLDACSECHRWITENPLGARAMGWNVSREDDPLLVPVEHGLYGLIVLDDCGGWMPSLPGVA